MTKMKKIFAKAWALLLVACMLVSMACCGKKDPDNTQPDAHEGENWTFTIQVEAEGGAPLEGIGVYVYEDEEQTELTWFDKTDAEGKITFTAPVKDGYRYAVLSDVPAGYIAEKAYPITGKENLFVLKAAAMEDLDPEDVRYKLGDAIGDFTVTDTDGNEYTLSQLLETKKAVMLNFWFIECNPCRAEFPYMNEAYAEYAGDVALIAMNCVNDSVEDIAAFKQELELDFPMAAVDPAWAQMLQMNAYPTTVVIDRTGVISMIHVGSIDDADTFRRIFQYFTAEDYTPGVIQSLDELPALEEDTLGTAENPYEQGSTGTELVLKPGQEYHVNFFKASGMYMNVTGSNFYVIYEGEKTNSSSGYVGMMVQSEGVYYPVKVIFGNPTDKEQKISIAFGALKGSMGNPHKLSLGQFDMSSYAGNEEGVFGSYTAEESGTLTVRCLSSSVSKYGFYLYNLRSYAMRNTTDDGLTDEDGYLYVDIQVKKGDQIQFSVGVDRNEDNTIPAGSFRFELLLEEGDGEDDKKAEAPKTAYSITVTDDAGNPLENVGVNVKGEFTYEPTENDPEDLEPVEVKVDLNLTTDADGHVITEQVTGPYTATIRVPEGFALEQTQYELTGDTYTVTVALTKIVMVDYVITVTDENSQAVAGVSLMAGANMGATDEQGKYAVTMESGEYTVFVLDGVPAGYVQPLDSFLLSAEAPELTITLEKEGEPEPEYIDIFGQFPIITDALEPGQKAYYNIYNAGGANLVIADADAYVIIGEQTYVAEEGVVTAPIPATMGRMPAQVIIGNGGEATESYTAEVVFPLGSQQNPEKLELGDFTAELAAGDSDGYYYSWTAEEDGVLQLTYAGELVAGEQFEVMLTNTVSCPILSESEDGKTVSVAVKAGEEVIVQVSSWPDENWEYPAISLELNAALSQDHVHAYEAVVTEPTCETVGFTTYTCACGESYVGDEVAALGHSYEAVVTAPTCAEAGYTTYTCSVCGHSYVGDEVAALGHSYEAVVTAPTCTENGYTTYTCSVCGNSYVGDEVAAAHSYEAVVTAPNCTENGYTTYTCSVCGQSHTADNVEALGHDYTETVVPPTASAEGYTLHTCSRCGDSYKDNYTEKLPPEHIHSYSSVVTAPTCAAEGYTTYTCICGESYVDNKVAALGHTEEAVAGKAATCTEPGLTEGKKCSVCGEILVQQTEIAALGHTEEAVAGKAATCTEPGLTEGKKCAVCGEILVQQTEIAALGHTEEAVAGKAATCTEPGLTEGKKCSVCGEILVQQAETAVLGHDFRGESCTRCGEKNADYKALTAGRWVWYAPAESGETMAFYILTFAEDRTFNLVADTAESIDNFDPEVQAALRENQPARLIDFEGKTYVTPMASFGYPGTYVVNADGTIALTGEEWIGGSAALQYVGGDKLEVLSDDQVGLPEQLVFQEAVHKHLFMDAATCTTPMICAICGETKGEALGHDYKAEVIAPTTDSEGYTLHTCSRCGDSYKDNYTEKLPQTANVTYTVTVTDFDGAPMSGVAVQILKDGKAAKVGVTDTNGKLSAELAAGDYTVKLAFSATGNHYDESIAVLSANVTELTIRVTSAVPSPGVVDHWMLGNADEVGLGGTYVTTQKNVMTYFLFTPTEAGTYSFTTSNPAAVISYWGGESFPSNQTANTDYKDNRFTLSVSQSYLGQTYVVGITGANSCILIIEKQGEAAFDPNEVPYTEYELAEQPKAFTATETGTLTFVDLSGKPEDYELVKGQDGFYHFGTADGPIAYICLGSKAPYLSLYTMCGGGGAMSGAPFRYADYSDLDNIVKEDYTAAVLAYGDCMDATYGVYPVTEDLIYIMQMGVEYKSWAKSESPNFLFTDVADFNAEMGWMFLFCYFQK